MTHIYKKWHLWDQTKPIEPWLSRVVSNQFKNLLRNYYGNYVRPCLKCPHNLGNNFVNLTKVAYKIQVAPYIKNGKRKKKSAYDIKLAVTMESHTHEIISKEYIYRFRICYR